MSNEKTKQEEIEKLDFDDVELNFEVKNIKIEPTDVESKNENSTSSVIPKDDEVMGIPSEGVSNKTSKDDEVMGTPSEGVSNKTSKDDEVMGTPSEGVSNKTSKDDEVMGTPSEGVSNKTSKDDEVMGTPSEGVSNKTSKDDEVMGTPSDGVPNNSSKDDKINNFTDSQKPRGLRDKIDDAKQKYQDRKDKFNDAKDKVKNAPDNLKKKRDELKDKWNNRPKNAKELGNRAKNAGKNLGKNIKQRTKDGIKQGAQNAFNNSRTGQAINKGKDLVDKGKKVGKAIKGAIKFFSTPAGWWTLAGIAIGLLIMVIIIMVPSLFASGSPGVGGEVQDEENYSKYSKVDQETIDELKKIYKKYPTGDPAYAMAATLYPYIDEMQNGNVASLRAKTNKEQEDSTDELYEDDSNENNNNENNNEKEEDFKDNEDDITTDDPYLELFRKRKYRKKFKKLLIESANGEEEFTKFLKDKWFDKDKGYKELFDGIDSVEELKDAIIDDILNQKDDFLVYFYDNCNTTNASITALNAAGNVNDKIKGAIYIRLRDYRDTNDRWVSEDHYASPFLYATDTNPIEFARYIMGVAYAEVGEGVKNEAVAKTIMVTAKSFTVGRYKSMGGEYPKPEFDEANNRTIIEMRGNVGDQDFCDVYEGCKEGTYAWSTRTEMRGSGDPKGPLSSNDIKNLEQWWNDIADVYVVNSSNGNFSGNQYDGYNDSCKKGSCVSQTDVAIAAKKESDYMNILFNADNGGFDSDSYQAFNSSTGGVYAVSTGNKYCPSSNITGSRQEIVNFAISMVGKIPYYFYEGQSDGYGALGHAISRNYDDNHFNEDASMTDHKGRNKYGLDCSGFVDFVFWNVLDNNLGNGNTTTLRSNSYKLSSYSDLIPGDLGFLSDEGSGTNQHVGIYIGNDEWVELNPNGVTKGEYPNFKVFYRPNILTELDQQENMDVVLTGSTVYENPIPGEKISNAYGVKGDLWSRGYHTGSDFGNNTDGKEIHSIGEGTVYCISCKGSSFGNHVVIEHADGYYSLYAHMSNKPKVIKGQKVNHSTILGNVGSTGNVTGPHLHLEFWKGVPWGSGSQDLNPANYIKL